MATEWCAAHLFGSCIAMRQIVRAVCEKRAREMDREIDTDARDTSFTAVIRDWQKDPCGYSPRCILWSEVSSSVRDPGELELGEYFRWSAGKAGRVHVLRTPEHGF